MRNEERINLRVVLHDMLSKPAQKIREEQQRLRESADDAAKAEKQLGNELDNTGKKLDKHKDAIDDVNDAHRDTVEVGKRVRKSTKENTDVLDDNTKTTKQNTKERRKSNTETRHSDGIITRVTRTMRRTGRGMLDFGSNYLTFIGMFKSLILTDLAPAIPILITGVTALGAGAMALIGPLGKLGSNIAHILPLYASLGTIMAVTTMAFSNMGDAIKVLNDPTATVEEINEAMSKLGPNAQKGARAMAGIAKEFKVIQGAVQETFWGGGMSKALSDFSKVFLPILSKGLIDAAKHMREAAKYSMRLFSGKREQRALSNVLSGAARSAGKLGVVFAEIGRVLLFITEAAMPVFEDFLDYVAKSFSGLGDRMDKDALTQFFRDAGEMAKGFWKGIMDIGGALRNTAKAAKPLTDYLTNSLGDLLDRWNKWTASDEGQKSMTEFFEGMIPNFEALGNLIGSLWTAFGELGQSEWFAPFVNDIANNVIPNISKIIKQLSDGLMPVFIELSESFTKFSEGQDITIAQPLIDLVTFVGKAFTWLFDTLSKMPPEVREFFTYMSGLALLGVPVLGLFRGLRFVLKPVGKLLGFVGRAFGGLFKGIGEIFKGGKIQKFFKPMLDLFGKIGEKIGLKGGLAGGAKLLGKRLITLAGPVGFVVGVLWMVWDVLKFLYEKFEWFRNLVDTVAGFISERWGEFLNNWRNNIIPGIGEGINGLVEWFRSIPTKVQEFIQSAVTRFMEFVYTLKTNIITGIAQFVQFAYEKLLWLPRHIGSLLATARRKFFEFVGYLVTQIVTKVGGFVRGFMDKVWQIRSGISKVIGRVKEIWNNLVDWLKTNIVSRITGFVSDAVNAFNKIGGGVRTAMDKIRDAASKPVDFVVNTVYNGGIRAMWNKIAGTFGLSQLPEVTFNRGGGGGGGRPNNRFATGGVMPGYTPGRDVHHFTSPTGGNLHLSGGEAIMRPEFTRQVGGKAGVDALNRMAINGNLNQAFSKGGITEFAGDLVSGAISKVKNIGKSIFEKGRDVANSIGGFVTDPIGTITRNIVKPAEALYPGIPNAGSPFSNGMLEIPKSIVGGLIDNAKKQVTGFFSPNPVDGASGVGTVHIGNPPAGGQWVRPSRGPITQRYGVPGVLSGLPHAGTDIAGGGKTYAAGAGTVYKTGWNILGGRSGIGIGISHGGGIFTYYGHNPVGGVQVRQGQKVRAGQHIGYQGSTGNVTGTHLHFELHKGGWGRNVNPSGVGVYDTGGWLMPGQMAMNMSGRPEPILNDEQFGWLRMAAERGVAGGYERIVATGGGTTTITYEGDTYEINIDAGDIDDPQELVRLIRAELNKIAREQRERK